LTPTAGAAFHEGFRPEGEFARDSLRASRLSPADGSLAEVPRAPRNSASAFRGNMSLDRFARYLAMAAALLLFAPALALAQKDTGTIVGNVDDEHGTPLAGAKITLTAENTKQSKGQFFMDASTDGTGEYRFESVRPGRYSMLFESKGLLSKTETVNVKAGHKSNVNVRLKLPFVPKTNDNNND
jgi:Carboxypeptidase regulatory-like domain